ncbi:MAG: hypothetical protein MUF62_04320, partial [Chitinophagaceae bacterium]|nr:hypothetical protein [Chitinophagaceae bacterium]
MRLTSLLIGVLVLGAGDVVAQTAVGIGTTNPNGNTMLHVESAAGNKGFMMPRLTTGQRVAMANGLGTADAGLLVLDRDLNQVFSWSGAVWQTLSRLTLPFYDSSLVGMAVRAPFQIIRNSAGVDGAHLVYLKNMNPQFIGAAFMAETNSNVFPGTAIYGLQTGTGDVAGAFRVDNSGSGQPALYGETNGSGSAVSGNALGSGNSVRGVKQTSATGNAINGRHMGTSGHAGLFQVTNAANNSAAIRIETVGVSQGLDILGAGSVPAINVTKPAGSSGQGIFIEHQGDSGPVAQIRRTNPNGVGAAIIGYNNSNQSQSLAIYGNHEGTGDAAIVGRINNAANPFSAVFAETNGTGSAIFANQLGSGRGAQIQIGSATSTAIATRSFTGGLGKAGLFTISNPVNADTAFLAETNGTGAAIAAVQRGAGPGAVINMAGANAGSALRIVNASNNSNSYGLEIHQSGTLSNDALYVLRSNGGGSAGNFQNTNASNTSSALYAQTNAEGGFALGVSNVGNGYAFSIFSG